MDTNEPKQDEAGPTMEQSTTNWIIRFATNLNGLSIGHQTSPGPISFSTITFSDNTTKDAYVQVAAAGTINKNGSPSSSFMVTIYVNFAGSNLFAMEAPAFVTPSGQLRWRTAGTFKVSGLDIGSSNTIALYIQLSDGTMRAEFADTSKDYANLTIQYQ